MKKSGKRPFHRNPDLLVTALRQYAKGRSLREIAKEYDVDHKAIYFPAKKYGIRKNSHLSEEEIRSQINEKSPNKIPKPPIVGKYDHLFDWN